MNLDQLNDDCIARIMCSFKMCDVNICFNLALTCRRFYDILCKNRGMIDDYFSHNVPDNSGIRHYYGNKLHRGNDLPAVKLSNETSYWYYHGLRHRDNDKPACVFPPGYKAWFKFGNRHREGNQPAVIYSNGIVEYWYDGRES